MNFTEKYRPEGPRKLKVFPAAFPGVCAECGDDIEEDDPVAYYDDDLCHDVCAEELVALE